MAGRHRKRSEVRTTVAKRGGSGVAAAALSITGLSTAVVTGTTAAVAPNVQLMALVSAANSTSQFFAGTSYYGTDWASATAYGPEKVVVPFFRGPQGIADAINDYQDNDDQTGVTASGWGAGQTGTALGILAEGENTEALNSIGLVILDNNTNRAGGGFWTTYYPFAPLLFTSADPTPTNFGPGVTNLKILDVGYEYNINGDAAVDPANPFALGNSLAAYAFGYGQESTALNITQEEPGGPVMFQPAAEGSDPVKLEPGTHYVVKDGNIVATYPAGTAASNPSTIYVTVQADNLPLTRLLRVVPGGDILANAVDPTLTDLVNAGYNDGLGITGNPAIPKDPTVPRPMKLFSSLSALDAGDLQDSAQEGATAGATTAFADIANPANFITKPIGEAAKLPGISSLTNLSQSTSSLTTLGAKNAPTQKKPATSTSSNERPRPLKKLADDVKDSLNKLAGKPAESGDEG